MFNESYQQELLSRLTQKEFLQRLGKLLRPEFFDPEYEPVVRILLTHWKKNKRPVTKGQLSQLCQRHGVKPKVAPTGDFSFDEEEILYFARDRVISEALAKSQTLRSQGKFEKAIEVVRECWKTFPHMDEQEAAPDILKSTASIPVRKSLIPTGLEQLDHCLDGGIGGGDLAAVLAPTSGGKTSWLVHVAAEAGSQGKKVYYLTLEVPRTEIEAKIRRCITGVVKPSRKAWVKAAGGLSRKGGRIQVREASPHSLSVYDLALRLEDDIELLIVDYADYLRLGDRAVGFSYDDLGRIYSDLKAIAMDRKISVWTASQVNRGAYGSASIGLQDIEASLKKAMVVDQAIALNQTSDHPDPKTGEVNGEINIAKNRHGIRFQDIGVTVNWALSKFIQGKWG